MPGIDLHTHLAPDLSSPVGPHDLCRPDRLVAHLDAAGLDEAVVTVPPPLYRQHLPATQAATWVAALNDGLRATVEAYPRLMPMAYLPLEHPTVACDEYRRLTGDPRWAGVTGAAGGGSLALDAAALRPLWELLDEDARTVQLHPGHCPDPRLAPHYLANLLGNPAETTLAAAQLVFGQVPATYPRLRFVLLHGGGFVAAAVGRWQRGYDTSRPGVPALARPPVEAVRDFYVDTLAHDPGMVDQAARVFGPDRLVLGSDWPFPMGTGDPAGAVRHRDPAHARQIATGNAAAALGRDH